MQRCPPEEQLAEFLTESLDRAACQLLEEHLAGCVRCQERLDQLSSDTAVEQWARLRQGLREHARETGPAFLDRLAVLSPGASAPPAASSSDPQPLRDLDEDRPA